MFLLDTCSVSFPGQLQSNHLRGTARHSGDRLIDFKLFLNTTIKEKIHNFERPFCDESFIVDHFWRAQFPHTSQSLATLNITRSYSPDVAMTI